MNNKGNKNIFTTIGKIISYLFLVFLFLLALFLIFYIVTNAYARHNNKKPLLSLYTIVSPSMEPNIMVYDVIFDVRVNDDKDLNEGDIITFYSDSIDTNGYTITHRIVKKYSYNGVIYYETKGDNNNSIDVGRITLSNIVGKYKFKLKGLGKVQFFVSSKLGWVLIILLPVSLIIIMDIFKLFKVYKIKKGIDKVDNKDSDKKNKLEKNKRINALIEKAQKVNKK